MSVALSANADPRPKSNRNAGALLLAIGETRPSSFSVTPLPQQEPVPATSGRCAYPRLQTVSECGLTPLPGFVEYGLCRAGRAALLRCHST